MATSVNDGGPSQPPPYSVIDSGPHEAATAPSAPVLQADKEYTDYGTSPSHAHPPPGPSPGYYPPQGAYPPPYPGPQPQFPVQQPYYPPAPPPGMIPAQSAPTTVVISQPAPAPAVITMTFGEQPVQLICPFCQTSVVTKVSYHAGLLTWLICLGLLFVGCFLCCCLIPFCVDQCQDAVHTCPSCRRQISSYKRLG